MDFVPLETRSTPAGLGFELIDRLALDLKTRGPTPHAFGPIRFDVIKRGGQRLPEPLEMIMRPSASGLFLFTGKVRSARSSEGLLSQGQYQVRVQGTYFQAAEEDIDLAEGKTELRRRKLEPSFAYPFVFPRTNKGEVDFTLLRGSLHLRNGAAAADDEAAGEVSIRLPRFDQLGQPLIEDGAAAHFEAKYRIDASAQWAIILPPDVFFPPAAPLTVKLSIRYPRQTPVEESITIERGKEKTLSETSLVGRVRTKAGLSLTGATVAADGITGATTTNDAGEWRFFFLFGETVPSNVTLTATLPDGRTQTIAAQPQPKATTKVSDLIFD